MTKTAIISIILLTAAGPLAFAFDSDFGSFIDPEPEGFVTVPMGFDFPGSDLDLASLGRGGVIDFPGEQAPPAVTPELIGLELSGGEIFFNDSADNRFTVTWLDIREANYPGSEALQITLYESGEMLIEQLRASEVLGSVEISGGGAQADAHGLDPDFWYRLSFEENQMNQWFFTFNGSEQGWQEFGNALGAIPEPQTTSLISLALLGVVPVWRRLKR